MTADLTIDSMMHMTSARAKWRGWIARHDLTVFFILAFLLSWYPWMIGLVRGTVSGPNPLGPFIAALIVTAVAEGRSGLRTLLGRIVRARIGWRSYAIVFGLPIVVCGASLAVMAAIGQSVSWPSLTAWRELPERFVFIFLFIGLGEEPGWRGFALPRLQKQHSPLVASLILAPIWALWHLPLMGNEFPPAIIPAFLISLLGGTLIQIWLFNRSKGSVFAQMLFHATVNSVGAGLVFPLLKGPAFVSFWYVYATIWLAVGLIVILSRGAEARSTSH
ncbi:MAG: type II CAAX prenyl endopeptidase Rce1 family protein [Chthoniobacterales bacterium]